jgi:hypothetical protein
MANAVMNFIWSQNDLRPDTDPVHVVMWNDDSYSRDLVGGFWKALRPVVTRTTVTDWAWVTGITASGAFPPYAGGGPLPVHRLGEGGSDFQMAPAKPYLIDSSVGTFDLPNRYEAERARELAREMLVKHQRRPLLVVTGQSQPCRRFLRALNRNAPGLALDRDVRHSGRRIVVATGDAVAFNTVYRDRQVAWPIQDLPFDFVFFCHHNPIDQAAGFQPEDAAAPGNEEGYTATTGTEDVLLYADIIEALVQAIGSKEGPCPGPEALSQRLAGARLIGERIAFGSEGVPLFTVNGNRHGGTGEHVVCLRPHFTRERVLPEADIEVWAWRSDLNGSRSWHRYDTPLPVYYGDAPVKGGGANGRD